MQKNLPSAERDLTLFFVIAFVWSWLFSLPGVLASTGVLTLPEPLIFVTGLFFTFGPAVAAFSLTLARQGKDGVRQLSQRGWDWRFPKVWLLPTLFLMPAFGILVILVHYLFGQNIPWEYSVPPIMIVPVFLLVFFLNALPEEYGWRGFALDRLQQRWNALTSSLILGVLHGLWHLPLHFTSGTTQAVIPVWEFVLEIVVEAVLVTWLYNNTGRSVLVATLFHTMGNMTGALIPFWTTEFGRWISFAILLVIVVSVTWVWKPQRLARAV